jgi:transcriptional regulator with XRE-family HTH domain
MAQNNIVKDLHIGNIIKEIAIKKGISSQKIADAIHLYQHNSDKIFKRKDMDVEDAVRISYLLEYNILELLSKQYLSHLPRTDNFIESASYLLKIDMKAQHVSCENNLDNNDFLKDTHIGSHIKKIALQKRWNLIDMANLFHCTPSMISYWYACKSLKIKTLISISVALQYNFIAEIYLTQMSTDFSLNKLEDFTIFINSQQICITNSNDKTILMIFQRNDDKKIEPLPYKI